MNDLISRQAAIDAVEKESQIDGAYGYMDIKSIVDLLSDLPSAQPEVVRCKDCAYGEKCEKLPDNIRCELLDYLPFCYEDFCSMGVKRVTGR